MLDNCHDVSGVMMTVEGATPFEIFGITTQFEEASGSHNTA